MASSEPGGFVTALRWIARIWGVLVILAGLVFFVVEADANPAILLQVRARPFIAVACIGLAIGLHWEALGGVIAVGSIGAFYLIELVVSRAFSPAGTHLLVLAPGILYLVCWRLTRLAEERHKTKLVPED
ncbi:MAG: hypothetical protein JXR94_09585 [Candidatus Hydrogenedentes bacterium]|nr:hypothetical protein [Candidatus Hydrogenedentota bacterium]